MNENTQYDVTGTWKMVGNVQYQFDLKLQQNDNQITGTMTRTNGQEPVDAINGFIYAEGKIVFTRSRPGSFTQVYTGQISSSGSSLSMEGTFAHDGMGQYPWSASKSPVLSQNALNLAHLIIINNLTASSNSVPNDIDVYPGDSIQKAIDAANPGDTVWVKPGTYYENININKPIFLEGWVKDQADSKSYPIVDAGGRGSAITLSANVAGVETFKVINSADSGLKVSSNDNIINQIVAENNLYGFYFENAQNNTFETCFSKNNQYGVFMDSSNSNFLDGINSDHNNVGLYFKSSNNNRFVYTDDISNNTYGIYLDGSRNNEFFNLWINDCDYGIYLINSFDNMIYVNVLCDNRIYNAYDNGVNQWYAWTNESKHNNGNFYGTCRYCINNSCNACGVWNGCFSGAGHGGWCDNPYNIPGGQNVDRYPMVFCNHFSGFTSKHKERK